MTTIKNILQNDNYNIDIITKLSTKKNKQNNIKSQEKEGKTKWATFTYIGKEKRKITKIFRNTIKVAFRTKNNIQHILKPKLQSDKYSSSGIYRMKCLHCPMEYIGQTRRRFSIRYKEHIHDIRHNSSSTGYSEHILNTGHTYGTMENTVHIIETNKKGQYLNTLENYHIYRVGVSKLFEARATLGNSALSTGPIK
jgi:hypothetical protein